MMRTFGISIFIGALLAVLAISAFFVYQKGRAARAANDTVTVQMTDLQDGSSIEQKNDTVTFSLFSQGPLYQNPTPGSDANTTVYDLLQKPISIENNNVKGASTIDDSAQINTLLPTSITSQLQQNTVINDQEDEGLKKSGKAARRKHIKFTQVINGVPVFGSYVSVHTLNESQVYAMTGSIIKEESIQNAQIGETDAANAVQKSESEKNKIPLKITSVKKVLFNPSLVGLNGDSSSYPTAVVSLSDGRDLPQYSHTIYISLVDGSVLFDEDLLTDALQRTIYDCVRTETCNSVRPEGFGATHIADVDSTYDHFGTIYAYYFNTFGRDSYNNLGGIIEGFVNLPDAISGVKFCPNAAWLKNSNKMYICPGWAVLDILAHEFTHGVNSATAGFLGLNQSGALDEAIADMVAVTIDDDWNFGEDTTVGIIRQLNNPALNRPPSADRLFDSKYYCGTEDNGGVHYNMSIPTKAFYLMAVGGQFNGCTMTGIGKDKAIRIWYQAVTRYMSFTSNFRDAYNAVVQACGDLYGAAGAECTTTRAALQATEMDQQPLATDAINRCTGAVRQTPTCALPITVTTTPTPSTSQCKSGDADCNGTVNLVDFEMWRREFLQIATTREADFNKDNAVNLVDYEMWRRGFLGI